MFKDTADFQQYLPVTNAFTVEVAMPHINKALRSNIIPHISQAEYNSLLAEYNANTLADNRLAAWKLLQEAAANLIFYYYLPFMDTQASDGGIFRIETDTRKSLYKYQKQELKEVTMQNSIDALDAALEFMETNKADFPAWTASTSYTVFNGYFLQNSTQFSQYVPINNSRVLFIHISPLVKEMESRLLEPILGIPLYEEMKSLLLNNSLNSDEIILRDKCNGFMACQIFKNVMPFLNLSFKNGIVRTTSKDDDNTKQETTSPNTELDFLLRDLSEKAESRKAEIVNYLNANVATFPLFMESKFYQDTTVVDTPQNQKGETSFWF